METLFRGKRIDDGEWVKGYYVRLYNDKGHMTHRIYPGYAETDCGDWYPDWFEVDPKTVGQFTGLYTITETPIFDGDIIWYDEKLFVVQRENETPGGAWSCTAYILQEVGSSGGLSFEDTIDDYHNEICVEIVGNVHDNPELLQLK